MFIPVAVRRRQSGTLGESQRYHTPSDSLQLASCRQSHSVAWCGLSFRSKLIPTEITYTLSERIGKHLHWGYDHQKSILKLLSFGLFIEATKNQSLFLRSAKKNENKNWRCLLWIIFAIFILIFVLHVQ